MPRGHSEWAGSTFSIFPGFEAETRYHNSERFKYGRLLLSVGGSCLLGTVHVRCGCRFGIKV